MQGQGRGRASWENEPVSSEALFRSDRSLLAARRCSSDLNGIKEAMLATLKASRPYAWALLLFQSFLIIIYFVGTDYSEKPEDPRLPSTETGAGGAISESSVTAYYWYFIHIVLMMPIGFGYLVTFLRRYRYSGVGFTFVLTAVIFQWSLIIVTFWEKVRRALFARQGAGAHQAPPFSASHIPIAPSLPSHPHINPRLLSCCTAL